MIPAPVKHAAAEIIAAAEKIASVRVPRNAVIRTYTDMLRQELKAHYGFSAVKICHETRWNRLRRKNEAWLVVVKPNALSFEDASKIEKWADSARLAGYQDGSAI